MTKRVLVGTSARPRAGERSPWEKVSSRIVLEVPNPHEDRGLIRVRSVGMVNTATGEEQELFEAGEVKPNGWECRRRLMMRPLAWAAFCEAFLRALGSSPGSGVTGAGDAAG